MLLENARLVDELRASRGRIATAAEQERLRLERDLHDGAQQRLVALLIRLRLAQELEDPSPHGAALLAEAESELETALDELREVSHGTHPAVLTDLGLATAIRSVAARASQSIQLVELPSSPLDATVERTAYYVFLEAVTNAQKYAPEAVVSVSVSSTERALTVVVRDNGPGGASEAPGGGLLGLRERVEDAGGTFSVQSVRRIGTTVTASIPL
jgi:signal transduction histidine kinase